MIVSARATEDHGKSSVEIQYVILGAELHHPRHAGSKPSIELENISALVDDADIHEMKLLEPAISRNPRS